MEAKTSDSRSVAQKVSAAARVSTQSSDDPSSARERFEKGTGFMDLGKYSEAAAEYEAAYADLVQAYRLAGNAEKALFFYRKYLQHIPKSPYRADIEEKIAALEKATGSPSPSP